MWISTAMAASGAAAAEAPDQWSAFGLNLLLMAILAILFYVLLIVPQQKRIKKHNAMLGQLKKGDKIITAGGFLGKIHKIDEEKNEVEIDLGNNVKVTALRSTIQSVANQ